MGSSERGDVVLVESGVMGGGLALMGSGKLCKGVN